ncbi:hypothetical protein BGP_4522 [Beggiatoa sp. PS]|nr:hypothetical protein BGP_4522 [Beggiatoa sp. PS]
MGLASLNPTKVVYFLKFLCINVGHQISFLMNSFSIFVGFSEANPTYTFLNPKFILDSNWRTTKRAIT